MHIHAKVVLFEKDLRWKVLYNQKKITHNVEYLGHTSKAEEQCQRSQPLLDYCIGKYSKEI